MEMLIAFAAVVLIAVCILRQPKKDQPPPENITAKRAIADIYTILENVEIYDGTPKGQKRIGGDK